jgi:pimeloyl-ACP methyl ester carboxylesterase
MAAPAADQALVPAQKSTNDRSILRFPRVLKATYQTVSRLSPGLGAEMTRQLFFRPPSAPYWRESHAVLALAQLAALRVRHRRVQAYCWGEGPTVLLLHGWGGHAGQMTEFVAPLTNAGYRVIALDAPAHGRSAGRLSSIVHFADAIQAAASTFGPLHAIVAHSLGAAATVYILGKGLPLQRAVFIAPQADLTGYWTLFREALGVSDDVWHLMRVRTERWLKVRYEQLQPAGIAPRMKTPLLILHGATDRMTPVSQGETLASLWPGAAFRTLDCGHLGILRDWRALLAATDFVKGVASPGDAGEVLSTKHAGL